MQEDATDERWTRCSKTDAREDNRWKISKKQQLQMPPSTTDKKHTTHNAKDATICKNADRCYKMKKAETDQLRINGSTDFWINGSTMKVNAPTTKMKKRKLPCILRKSSYLKNILKCPAEDEYCCSIINAFMCLVVYHYICTIACI